MDMDHTSVMEALAWLKQFDRFHIHPGLERMKAVLEKLGEPDRELRFIHIAGTNGKGSTGAFIRHVLKAHGWSVASFTSPAIMHELDRIQYNGNRIDDEAFLACADRVQGALVDLEEGSPTEFEVITLIAIVYFHMVRPEWIIWETGLGGRWDATNVVRPAVAVITNIGHDHQMVLGETLEQIAEEKAGIVKPGCPVVTAVEPPAESVIQRRANELDCPYYSVNDRVQVTIREKCLDGVTFSYKGLIRDWDSLTIRLPGDHQVGNAALSLMTLEVLEKEGLIDLKDTAVRDGLHQTMWPGRMELVTEHPRILLDAAHNPEAVAHLVKALKTYFTYKHLILVIGIFKDKEVAAVAKPLGELADDIFVTVGSHPRYVPAEKLAESMRSWCSSSVAAVPQAEEAIQMAIHRSGRDDLILVAGSHDLMSIVRKYLLTGGVGR